MSTNNGNNSSRRSRKGGRQTKVDNQAANIAPEGNAAEQTPEVEQQPEVEGDKVESPADEPTVEQPQEVADAIVAEADGNPAEVAPAEAPTAEMSQADQQITQADELHPSDGEPASDDTVVPETPEAEQVAVDPFANLPITKIEDYEFRDFATAETSDPRKYTEVQKAAIEGKLPIKPNWKHSAAMITTGRVQREFREGSVYGTIDQIVRSYGRAGVPAYVLVPKVREAQIGNKRSHYCTSLPPIGWAEGWIDTYISKGHGKVMEKKAPALTAEVKQELLEGQVAAEAEAQKQAA